MDIKSLIVPIPKGAKTGWTAFVKMEEGRVVHIILSHPSFGMLCYGMTPGGYDGWSFHEIGGGGVVSVPFAKINGQLYIGMVNQARHNQGGKVWNVPRGFLNPGQTNFEALNQELAEELGYTSPDKLLKKLGIPMNPNSAFFETPEPGEGVKFVSVEVVPDMLVEDSDDDTYSFKPGIMKPVNKSAELIFQCKFFPWRTAVGVSDMFTSAAIARLLATELIF